MEVPDFFHKKLHKLIISGIEKLQVGRYFRLSTWDSQNASKEFLMTLSKFHEKIPRRSGVIKNFRLSLRTKD